jgi:5-(carboxyamino)imidazole ribonucleotide mutase
MPEVAVVMGSKSDLEVCLPAVKILKKFGVKVSVRIISAHRTPEEARKFSLNAASCGVEVIIAAAGKAAHLAGVIAANTVLPVIGIPVKSSTMDGLDSLLSMVQMPSGVPVACVAINGGENAGLLALQMLSLKYPEIGRQLAEHKKAMAAAVIEDDLNIQKEIL